MTQWFVFETLTGRILTEFEPTSASWSDRLNEPETLDVTIALTDPQLAEMDWRNLGTPWKHGILVEESGRLYGGPIQPHNYEPGSPLKVVARGLRAYFARRRILPPVALELPLVTQDGEPNDLLDTVVENVDLGTIGQHIVKQACAWRGSAFPIVWHPERPGTRRREYHAVELKRIDEALEQLSGVENGPDFGFYLRWKIEGHSVEWVFASGTEDRPRLSATHEFVWDVAADESAGADLTIATNPSEMGSLSWATAGRGDDSVLVAQSYDTYLLDAGMPLMEVVDTSHTNVTEQSTLDGYARENLRTARQPSEFWSFRASLLESPWLSEYRPGDYCTVQIAGDPYISDGTYRRRILELSGDDLGLWVDITCGEAFDAGGN